MNKYILEDDSLDIRFYLDNGAEYSNHSFLDYDSHKENKDHFTVSLDNKGAKRVKWEEEYTKDGYTY